MAIALVFSVVTPARAATVAELQAMIAQLMAQVATMQGQSGTFDDTRTLPSATQLTTNLALGSRSAGVVTLQNFLVSEGFLTIPNGLAKGYFGPLTKSAVIKYQVANGLSENVGYVGPLTRSKINSMLDGHDGGGDESGYIQPDGPKYSPYINIISPKGGEVFMVNDRLDMVYATENLSDKATLHLYSLIYGNVYSEKIGRSDGKDSRTIYPAKQASEYKSGKYKIGICDEGNVNPEVTFKPLCVWGKEFTVASSSVSTSSCIGYTPSISDIKLQSNVNAVKVPTKSVYVGDSVKIEWEGRCLDTFNVTLRDIKGKEVYKTIAGNTLKNGAFWTVTEADYNKDEYVTIHIETTDGKYKETTSKIAISKRADATKLKISNIYPGDTFNFGSKEIVRWSITPQTDPHIPKIIIVLSDTKKTYLKNVGENKDGYFPYLGAYTGGNSGEVKINLPTASDVYVEEDYLLSLRAADNTPDNLSDNKVIDEVRVKLRNKLSVTPPTSVESYIDSEARLGSGDSITLRPSAYETVYGIKYSVKGNPVTVQRLDVRLVDQGGKRYAGNYIDSIQLLDMNQKSVATLRGSDGNSDDEVTSYRFTGLNLRLEDDGGYYVRINTKSVFPDTAEFDILVPKDGVRFDDNGVSEVYGLGMVKREINFDSRTTSSGAVSIPFNSPDYQRMEISLPNGTKQAIYEKKGTLPPPRILSMSKINVGAGESIVLTTQNVAITKDAVVYIDTFKGVEYHSNIRAVNDGFNQKITVPVSPSLANGQYYVYLVTDDGISNYRGLTVQSGQGANVYSIMQELLNKLSEELANQ